MKLLISAVLLLVPHLASSSDVEDHFAHVPMAEVAGSIIRLCAKKTGATKEDIVSIEKFESLHSTREAKCFLACSDDVFGIFDSDGAPVIDSLDLYFSAQFEPHDREKAMAIWQGCYDNAIKADIADKCEFSYKLNSCFFDQANQEQAMKKIVFF